MSLFRDKAVQVTKNYDFVVTIDSSSIVTTISNGNVFTKPGNEHGEADYAMWHHSIQEQSNNILMVSCDTDTWVYGLGLYELELLANKN